MTVAYTSHVASIGGFKYLLFRWRGSVYKLVWKDLLAFLLAFYLINAIYRSPLLDQDQKEYFMRVSRYCSSHSSLIPLSFVLGFYVNFVCGRWYMQYRLLAIPDNLAITTSALIPGSVGALQDERSRMLRRTIMRYINLAFIITMRLCSVTVKKRFPTSEHLVEAGCLLPHEKDLLDELDDKSPYWWVFARRYALRFPLSVFSCKHPRGALLDTLRHLERSLTRSSPLDTSDMLFLFAPVIHALFFFLEIFANILDLIYCYRRSLLPNSLHKHWLPLLWAKTLVLRAYEEGLATSESSIKFFLEELTVYRTKNGRLLGYDSIPIPLVYTQVVTLAVYSFSLVTVIGSQTPGLEPNDVDTYVPVFAILQFVFYMGWLRVAETLVNPFGEDDDDFEVNSRIDRNMQVSWILVDEVHNLVPETTRDVYWEEKIPVRLPYNIACVKQTAHVPERGSTADILVSEEESHLDPLLDNTVESRQGTPRVSSVRRLIRRLSRQSNQTPQQSPALPSRRLSVIAKTALHSEDGKKARLSALFEDRVSRHHNDSHSTKVVVDNPLPLETHLASGNRPLPRHSSFRHNLHMSRHCQRAKIRSEPRHSSLNLRTRYGLPRSGFLHPSQEEPVPCPTATEEENLASKTSLSLAIQASSEEDNKDDPKPVDASLTSASNILPSSGAPAVEHTRVSDAPSDCSSSTSRNAKSRKCTCRFTNRKDVVSPLVRRRGGWEDLRAVEGGD
ncbi:bestrophin-2-like [Penaeus indicus]|uniref:bestrophin-2-like n=1 Tax=Penaeus indicus TaxID=29960 RepID=UPI00300D8639